MVVHYIQLYSPHNMVAQANKTSKNTTNAIEKMTTVPLYTYELLNSQNQLEIGLLDHLAQQVRMIFSERKLKFMFAICHRQSVCRLSVCNVGAPYSGD